MIVACVWLAEIGRLAAAHESDLERFEYTEKQMGVPFKLVLYSGRREAANRAQAAAFGLVKQLNASLSDYDGQSELSRLSRASPMTRAMAVSDPLWAVLRRSQDLALETGGAFDVTVGPYVKLWRRARRQKQLPSPERLAAAKDAVGFAHVQLDPDRHAVRLLKPNMRLDLGGIATGYAVDEMLRVLREHGISRAMVDASGDIGAGDPPPGEVGWKIAIALPSAKAVLNQYVLLSNRAITTSGDAFQFVEIGGKRYSHIVDPHTGLGLTDHSNVTVLAADCITADSLATAVSVLGPDEGLRLIERTPGAAAQIIVGNDAQPRVYHSQRWSRLNVVGRRQ